MSVPTVKEHLSALEKAGLVKRHEEGRKWIYYSLTEKSKCVLDPERKRLWIVLGFFILSAIGTAFSAVKYFSGPVMMGARGGPVKTFAAEMAMDSAEEAVATGLQAEAVPTAAKAAPTIADAAPEAINQAAPVVASQPPYVLIGFVVLTIILFILGIYFYKRSKLGRSLKKK